MNPLRRRSVQDLAPAGKLAAYLVLVGWALVVLFPLYWLVITSFKLPIQVNSGPFYLPFVDFQPSLDAWRYIFVDLRDDTIRPYVNTVVVALGSSVLALLLGSAAAYALIRVPYKPRLGFIGLLLCWRAFKRAVPSGDARRYGLLVLFLPSLLLSGFMFPYRGMPGWAQALGEIFPLTHFLRITRAVMLKGADFHAIAAEIGWLVVFVLVFAGTALLRFRRTLD